MALPLVAVAVAVAVDVVVEGMVEVEVEVVDDDGAFGADDGSAGVFFFLRLLAWPFVSTPFVGSDEDGCWRTACLSWSVSAVNVPPSDSSAALRVGSARLAALSSCAWIKSAEPNADEAAK